MELLIIVFLTRRRLVIAEPVVAILVVAGLVFASWAEIEFFIRFEFVGINEQGYPEYRHRKFRTVFVKLPGGGTSMGTSKVAAERAAGRFAEHKGSEYWRDVCARSLASEQPQHRISLTSFLISKYEVTQELWVSVMGDNPSYHEGLNRPVDDVTWFECKEFCSEASFSLPTEAQWEYACRGGDVGFEVLSDEQLNRIAWYANNAGRTQDVGLKEPNSFGLHDLYGNVSEWCDDIYVQDFYSRPEARGPNPICTSGGDERVIRGGDIQTRQGCPWVYRPAHRNGIRPEGHASNLGFRVVYNLQHGS